MGRRLPRKRKPWDRRRKKFEAKRAQLRLQGLMKQSQQEKQRSTAHFPAVTDWTKRGPNPVWAIMFAGWHGRWQAKHPDIPITFEPKLLRDCFYDIMAVWEDELAW